MTQHVRFRLDDDAAAAVDALRARAATAGCSVPPERAALTAAAAVAIPSPARSALADELRLLALPAVWLATLGSTADRPHELVLAAVVDTELLAVHNAVHDALARRVRGPVAAYLPGAWLPYCVLASTAPAEAFTALHPVEPVRAQVVGVEIADARSGEIVAVH
ncbi:MAG TPA: 2'-5' RNA ligase family protein [Pseudonocardia sp.]|nr:2'-5' RNA ligase family protein [Pseudonocardia sp.]